MILLSQDLNSIIKMKQHLPKRPTDIKTVLKFQQNCKNSKNCKSFINVTKLHKADRNVKLLYHNRFLNVLLRFLIVNQKEQTQGGVFIISSLFVNFR